MEDEGVEFYSNTHGSDGYEEDGYARRWCVRGRGYPRDSAYGDVDGSGAATGKGERTVMVTGKPMASIRVRGQGDDYGNGDGQGEGSRNGDGHADGYGNGNSSGVF